MSLLVNNSAGPISLTAGGSATLSWTGVAVTACAATGAWSGPRPVSGLAPTGVLATAGARTYTLTCTAPGVSVSDSVTVNVSAAPPPPPPPPPSPVTPTTTPATAPVPCGLPPLIGPLGLGMHHARVGRLQEMLSIYFGFDPAKTTLFVDGRYDAVTVRAVKRFQLERGLVSSGTPSSGGYGLAGPRTRGLLNSLCLNGTLATVRLGGASTSPPSPAGGSRASLITQLQALFARLLTQLQQQAGGGN